MEIGRRHNNREMTKGKARKGDLFPVKRVAAPLSASPRGFPSGHPAHARPITGPLADFIAPDKR